jgi:very-short-patch-repair endonuclease
VTHIGRENEDAARTRHLEQRGYRVLRFTDDEVLRNLDAVAITIAVAAGLEM